MDFECPICMYRKLPCRETDCRDYPLYERTYGELYKKKVKQ